MNAHNITHLEDQVKCLGPLWTHSCFAFEAMISHLLKAYNGTRGVADQVMHFCCLISGSWILFQPVYFPDGFLHHLFFFTLWAIRVG